MDNAPPSHDPASEDSLPGLLYEAYKKYLQGTNDMLPARVVSYDRDANRAHIQPLIAIVSTNGAQLSRQGTVDVPVYQFGGGGFIISCNVAPGDLGWLKANDRDISLFLQSYSETPPNTFRLHSFEDAMFFPDPMRGYEIAGEDAGNLVIQNLNGSVRVSLWPDKIKMTAPIVEINGELHVTGPITSDTEVSVGAIALTTHKTSGVTPGGGTSSVPVP